MASFLAGMGGGYLKAREKTAQDERQARLDAQATDLHNARMSEIGDAQAERQRERDYRGAMESALSAGKTDTGFQVTDAAGSNAFTKDQDAAGVLADMAGTINGGASAVAATRVSTGMQGATQRGTIPGQQVFTDPAKAQDFAKTMKMSDYAELKARQDVAKQYAKLDIADDMRAKLENLAQKGVFQAYQHLDAGNAEGALKVLQNANPNLVPANSVFKQVDVPDMFDRTKTVKGWSLVAPGEEGQSERVVVGDFRDAVFGYLSPEKQFDLKHKVADTDVRNRMAAAAEKKNEAYMQSLLARAGGGSKAASGLNMDALDKQLGPLFATEDQTTGTKTVNAQGLIAVRQLALSMPSAARGDATGAALEAYNAYTVALQEAGGDQAKAVSLIQQALRPTPPVADQPGQPQAPSAQPGKTVKSPFADDKPAPAVAKPKPVEPKGRVEFQQFQQALQMGYQPASRGNAVFGQGEILYVNPKTGDRKWASQLLAQ